MAAKPKMYKLARDVVSDGPNGMPKTFTAGSEIQLTEEQAAVYDKKGMLWKPGMPDPSQLVEEVATDEPGSDAGEEPSTED